MATRIKSIEFMVMPKTSFNYKYSAGGCREILIGNLNLNPIVC